MTTENPHKIMLWSTMGEKPARHSLECKAPGCDWKIPTNEEYEDHARKAAQEHIDMWNLRQTNGGHVGLIGVLTAERDAARKAYEAMTVELAEGRLSDGFHSHNELYRHRMVLTAHAALGWKAAGYLVVKSWQHSDGEPCFGGGWFIVLAKLPTVGLVSYHYKAEHWDLFEIPEVEGKDLPAFDGHTADDVASRLTAALYVYGDDTADMYRNLGKYYALDAMGVDNWDGYEAAMEEVGNEDLRVRVVLAAIRPQPLRPGPSVHRLPDTAAVLVAPGNVRHRARQRLQLQGGGERR